MFIFQPYIVISFLPCDIVLMLHLLACYSNHSSFLLHIFQCRTLCPTLKQQMGSRWTSTAQYREDWKKKGETYIQKLIELGYKREEDISIYLSQLSELFLFLCAYQYIVTCHIIALYIFIVLHFLTFFSYNKLQLARYLCPVQHPVSYL